MLIVQLLGYSPAEISGHEQDPLIVKDFNETVVVTVPAPRWGWTGSALMDAMHENDSAIKDAEPAEFYLGELWIGSTEM